MTELSYATRVNKEYESSESNFVTLQQRLNEALDKAPHFKVQLDQAVDEFKRRNPKWGKFADINLCKGLETSLNCILIDASMQRQPNIRHIINIINNFRETMVMSLQVYQNSDGKYVAWDGQHTAIALYIIAALVYGERLAKCIVPIVVYSTSQKLEIRRNFILLNGDAKEPLDFIDTYKQMVFGVKVDGADDPEWLDAAQKNDYLAAADLFATNTKFGDEDEAGALTLLADTLMSKTAKTRKNPEVTRMFCDYWARLNANRPVDAKEARQLFEYFNLCYEQGIKVDGKYLSEFVTFTKEFFEADFSPNGMFWSKVQNAYNNWYRSKNETSDDLNDQGEVIVRGFTTEMRTGIPFLIAQLKKSTKLATPKYVPNNGFAVAEKDLWD
jgi:hypothetical protein